MTELRTDVSKSVLKRYTRAIVHMRQQFERKQFGLVFGAGIGVDLNFPSWKTLLQRISEHKDIDSAALAQKLTNSTALAQQLFQIYKSQKLKGIDGPVPPKMLEMELRAGWRKIVHECLYKDLPEAIDDLLAKDRYLESLVPLIKGSPLTVTYNFDDTLQRILLKNRGADVTKGYRTCWSGNVQLHSRVGGGVIYHPNGFLPSQLRERPSDHLVFSEDSFADQLIDSMSGQYASLATHFSQTTCLLVGLSLDDPTLKHQLRHTANHFPGHFHYYISFVSDQAKRNVAHEEIECAANFDVHNLITLYLTAEEIKALAKLIAADANEFQALVEEEVSHSSFRFFIVGSVGAGKSTTVGHFRSLLTQDEWTEQRAPNMEKAPDLLTEQEQAEIDRWVAEQVGLKNRKLLETTKTGLHIIDRAPLDAFAFTLDPKEWSPKAKLLKDAISPGSSNRKLAAGHVIFLEGSPHVMAERAVSLHKDTTAEKLELQQKELLYVYKKLEPATGLTVINVQGRTVREVVKDVAQVIYRDEYVEAEMHELLVSIEKKGR